MEFYRVITCFKRRTDNFCRGTWKVWLSDNLSFLIISNSVKTTRFVAVVVLWTQGYRATGMIVFKSSQNLYFQLEYLYFSKILQCLFIKRPGLSVGLNLLNLWQNLKIGVWGAILPHCNELFEIKLFRGQGWAMFQKEKDVSNPIYYQWILKYRIVAPGRPRIHITTYSINFFCFFFSEIFGLGIAVEA